MRFPWWDWLKQKWRGEEPFIDNYTDTYTLDVGSGSGDRLHNADVALDPSFHHCVDCKRKGVLAVQGRAEKCPFKEESFGAITSIHTIEHFSAETLVGFLRECFRLLQPFGFLILESPMPSTSFWDTLDHVRPYPPKAIRKFLNRGEYKQTYDSPDFFGCRWFVYSGFPYGLSLVGNFLSNRFGWFSHNYRMVLWK